MQSVGAIYRRMLRLQRMAECASGDRLSRILARLSDCQAHINFVIQFGVI